MKKILYLLTAAAIVAGCSNDDTAQMQGQTDKPAASELKQLVFGTDGTRAHWEDGVDKLSFAWDADNVGTELICAISSEGSFTPGYKVTGNEVGAAEYASYLTIEPGTADAGTATFTTVNSFPVAANLAGCTIYAVTPVGSDKVTSTVGSFSVEMQMPNTFTQTASGDLTHLKPYMQMYATATLTEGDNNLTFSHIPATIGFNIVNGGTTAVTVKSVTIDAVEASNGILAAPLSSSAATYSVANGLVYGEEDTHTAVTTVLGSAEGVSIDAESSYLAYALLLPLASSEALQNAYLRVRVTTTEGTYTLYTLSCEQLKTMIEADTYNWQSGQFYGFKLTIPELDETACTLPTGADFKTALLEKFTETSTSKVRFVAGSSKTSDSVLSGTTGTDACFVLNGDWLEIHTSAKEFMANASCAEMFYSSSIKAIDFGCNFNTENVTSMSQMFRSVDVEALDLLCFNTEKVDNFKQMFQDDCKNFKSDVLDLTGFSFASLSSKGTYVMFRNNGFTKLYVTRDAYDILSPLTGSYEIKVSMYDKVTGSLWADIIAGETAAGGSTE